MDLKKWAGWVIILVLAAGCQSQDAPLPTLMPTALPELPTATAVVEPTVPTTPPIERPTLPPTWTPSPDPSIITATPTPDTGLMATEIPRSLPTLEVCAPFRVDRSRYSATFTLGSAPQVAWTPVETAQSYRVTLIDEFGRELFTDYTLDTVYIFRADLFERGKRYGWEVYPIDVIGQQMCLQRGDELILQ